MKNPTQSCVSCEVRDLLSRYAVALDTRDAALLESCFTPDVKVKYQMSHISRELSLPGVLDLARGLAEFDRTTHHVGTVHVDDEGDTVKSYSYTTAYLVSEEDGEQVLLSRGVQYRDEMRRHEGQLRVHRRTHSVSWEMKTPVLLDPDLPACAGYGQVS